MSNDLTEAERAAADVLLYEEGSEWSEGTERHEELARAVLAAVRPIIEAEVLSEARALHARPEHVDSWGNRWCPACSAGQYYQEWPCPTAVALGMAGHDDHEEKEDS